MFYLPNTAIYENYEEALVKANLESLNHRIENCCKNCAENKTIKKSLHFIKEHPKEVRKYIVFHASTERIKKYSIPYTQRLLNKKRERNKIDTND